MLGEKDVILSRLVKRASSPTLLLNIFLLLSFYLIFMLCINLLYLCSFLISLLCVGHLYYISIVISFFFSFSISYSLYSLYLYLSLCLCQCLSLSLSPLHPGYLFFVGWLLKMAFICKREQMPKPFCLHAIINQGIYLHFFV